MHKHHDDYRELLKILDEGTLSKQSKERFEHYNAILAKYGAKGNFPPYMFDQLCENIRTILAVKTKEEADEKRHQEIQRQLDELKKPHWTVNPNFWFTSIAAISGIVGCILTWNSSHQSKSSPPASVQQSTMSTSQQPQKKLSHQQIEHRK